LIFPRASLIQGGRCADCEETTISIGIISLSVSLVVAIVLPIEFSQARTGVLLATDLAYPVADPLLLSLTVLSLAIFAGGSMSKWWYLLVGAIILDIVADRGSSQDQA